MAEHADTADQLVGAPDEASTEPLEAGKEYPAASTGWRRISQRSAAIIVGLASAVAVGGLAGWLDYRAHQGHEAQMQRNQFVEVARQAAVNLTTISYTEADADVKRILDSSTGQFHDDFQNRSQPFIDVVKQAKSDSRGTVTAAALESESHGSGQVLVAVSVKTSNAGVPEQDPRAWRMRITVHGAGDSARVSDVQFVP